jgi:phosphopentomutase
MNEIDEDDVFIITADHGNDPTTPSTDHSREYVPLLYFNKKRAGINLGIRKTYSDVAKTACDFFKVKNYLAGESFLHD